MVAHPTDRRTITLPRGDTLVIRAVTPADVDRLKALYAGLDERDTYRRFFSVFRPRDAFFERMAAPEERGGFGLVAAVAGTAPGGDDRIVAEAGYTLLPDGDGELAITVAASWRGWLGPYLLDALLEAAAARGVANLQADVLVTNGPMLALVRSRGYATVDHPDGTLVRVTIGAAARTPSWPPERDRPRVLVESPGGRWHAEDGARAAGLQVIVCPGPGASRSRCPALEGHTCPLVAGADAVVISHPLPDDRWVALPDAHRAVHPGVPVCMEVAPAHDVPPGEQAVPRGGSAEVVAFVGRLAARGDVLPNESVTIDPSARA
jgi:ribosomal protein S18 acetylase RimI-like enzyme